MLQAENKQRYPEYKQAKAKMIELLTAKNNVERILGVKRKIVTASRRRVEDFSLPAGNSRRRRRPRLPHLGIHLIC